MKFNNSDLRFALDQAAHYRQLGNDATAAYWTKRADEIAAWLEAKKNRAAHRRELKKAGLWKQSPTAIEPVTGPALDWVNHPEAAIAAFTRMVLDAEGASKCSIQVRGNKAVSFFRWPANFIRFSFQSISYLKHQPFQEYATVRWVWNDRKNIPGETALKMLALHEAAHAIDYARSGYIATHHHQSQYQAILRELAQKYAEPAFVPAHQPVYA